MKLFKSLFPILLFSLLIGTAYAEDKLVTTMSGRSYYNVYDEDDMASDSASGISTQQSLKAYVDSGTGVLTNKTLDDATVKFGDTADTTKDLYFSLGGATTVKTMTIISSQTDDRSLTLPDATDTLVGKATTDSLSNKSLVAPALGTPASGVLTSCTGLPPSTGLSAFIDDDTMGTASAANVASGESIKAYVDGEVLPKIYLTGEIADISSAASTWVTSPVGGDITRIYTVIDGAITTPDAGISFEIAATPVTNGGITIDFTTSAAGIVDTATPTAARTVTAGQSIEIITDGASVNAVKAVVVIEITPTATNQKKYIRGEVVDISDLGVPVTWVVSPIAGTITKIYSVIDATISAADAILTCSIGGTAITAGAITVANGSTAGTVDSSIPSALNVVTAGQAISIVSDGGSTDAAGAVILFEITP